MAAFSLALVSVRYATIEVKREGWKENVIDSGLIFRSCASLRRGSREIFTRRMDFWRWSFAEVGFDRGLIVYIFFLINF